MAATRQLTLVTFGIESGSLNTNRDFDVSFLENPARDERWGPFAKPAAYRTEFVLDQDRARAFLETTLPLPRTPIERDGDVRIGLGCSSVRHRSRNVANDSRRRLEDEDLPVRPMHREEACA